MKVYRCAACGADTRATDPPMACSACGADWHALVAVPPPSVAGPATLADLGRALHLLAGDARAQDVEDVLVDLARVRRPLDFPVILEALKWHRHQLRGLEKYRSGVADRHAQDERKPRVEWADFVTPDGRTVRLGREKADAGPWRDSGERGALLSGVKSETGKALRAAGVPGLHRGARNVRGELVALVTPPTRKRKRPPA